MNAQEFNRYHKDFNEVITGQGNTEILDTLDVSGTPHVILRSGSTLHAVPVSLVGRDQDGEMARLEGGLSDYPAFSEKQWREQRKALGEALADYADRTTPEINEHLRNIGESRHEGYEGSVQEFQRPKKGPDPSEGLDYDKARGNPDEWK